MWAFLLKPDRIPHVCKSGAAGLCNSLHFGRRLEMKRALLLTCLSVSLLVITFSMASADDAEPTERVVPELQAYRINPHAPVIDGVLSDAIWDSSNIQRTSSFTQREPDDGMAPTESTTVAVAYDDDAVYVAFWCYDSEPDKVTGQLVRRDREAESDCVTFRVDPFHDHQTGHAFEVSAAGVQRDCRYYNENNADMSWDAVWESGVSRQPWGWSAEIRIPYHCLRFSNKEEHIWGVDFQRRISRKEEYARWAHVPVSTGGFVSNFGHLTGLRGIVSASHLELLPYAVSSVETEPTSPGNPNGRDLLGNAGFDLKYALSSNLVLDATFNPDFGQVELDQPVINLSTYETFFSERRPFFLEGSDLYETDFMLFYSRRIGRTPWRDADDDEFAYFTSYPKSTTILGAIKLTGRLSERTSIALLSAVTEKEVAKYAAETNVVLDSAWNGDDLETTVVSADTVFRDVVVEPTANYTVLRIKRDILRNSSVGGMLTMVGQESVHPSITGGFDWRLSTNNSAWVTRGQAVFSRVDGDVTGYGFDATFEKAGGQHVHGAFGFTVKDPYLSMNRLGYTSRSDTRHVWAWMQYVTTDDWWIIRNSYHNLNYYSSWNFDGVRYQLGGNYNTYIEFKNFWSLGGGVEFQGERYSDVETRGYGLWEWPVRPTISWWFSLNTDQRKKLSFNWNPGSGADRGGSWWANYLGFEYRLRSNMEFSLGANYSKYTRDTRWVATDYNEEKPVFGDLYRETVSLYASGGVVVNRNLSVQLSAQGLISGLDYRNYRHYLGGQDYSDPLTGFNNDYNYSALNSTLLLRWEYRPGSTLYMVWTRSCPEFDDSVNNLDFSRDFKRLFSGNAQNVFLIKASYWLNI